MITSRRAFVSVIFGAALGGTLVGCGAPSGPPALVTSADIKARADRERADGHDYVAEVLSDGAVTEAEYLDSIDVFTACMSEFGYVVSDPVLSPMDSLSYMFSSEPAGQNQAEFQGNFAACDAESVGPIGSMYTASHKPTIDEPLRVALIACLAEQGYDVPADAENYYELQAGFADDANWTMVFGNCLGDAGKELYPGITGFTY